MNPIQTSNPNSSQSPSTINKTQLPRFINPQRERVWVRSVVRGGRACELRPWSYSGERKIEIRERFCP